jgi:DNA-binding SARP family transcriptional activator
MAVLNIQLFGRLVIKRDDHEVVNIDSSKALELFCYLLLYRDRPHHRERLAGLLWDDCCTAQSKKYLRQTLWQLQTAINTEEPRECQPVVLVDPDWVQINPKADLQLDVAFVEKVYQHVQGIRGTDLHAESVSMLRNAVDCYKGHLLEGWYQDWCLFERERFQIFVLGLLDKLVEFYEARGEFGAGLEYGTRILRFDRARERTHRRLMMLFYLSGDRTAALRQFDRCVTALQEELGVGPSMRTVALCKRIQADDIGGSSAMDKIETDTPLWSTQSPLVEVLSRLQQVGTMLTEAQRAIQEDIQKVEQALSHD